MAESPQQLLPALAVTLSCPAQTLFTFSAWTVWDRASLMSSMKQSVLPPSDVLQAPRYTTGLHPGVTHVLSWQPWGLWAVTSPPVASGSPHPISTSS